MQWAIIRGIRDAHPAESTFAFSRDILGYDLRAFFERSSARLRTEVEKVLSKLLSAEGS